MSVAMFSRDGSLGGATISVEGRPANHTRDPTPQKKPKLAGRKAAEPTAGVTKKIYG
jgi:hypothetical protein